MHYTLTWTFYRDMRTFRVEHERDVLNRMTRTKSEKIELFRDGYYKIWPYFDTYIIFRRER
jgi:hypothetical protein